MNTVWKIAPGEHACVWDECREDKCITINWLNRTNCLDFEDKHELRQALIKANEGKGGGGAPSIWQFCRKVQQGDFVIANEGLSRVVGIGLVRSGYLPPGDRRNPRKAKDYHCHARLVDWVIDQPIDFPTRVFVQQTVQRLPPATVTKIINAYSKDYPDLKRSLESLFKRRIGPAPDEAEASAESKYQAPDGDRREIAWQQIKKRRGQPQFREALLRRFERHCAITGCGLVDVLEAAHIDPYRGDGNNHPGNGLLLRADIHTLFDLDLLGIEPNSLQVELHQDIAQEYGSVVGKTLRCAENRRPLQEALKRRYRQFQEKKECRHDGLG